MPGGVARFANHSCEPNTSRSINEAGHVRLRALRDIEAGEELFTSYVDADGLSVDQRRTALMAKYAFVCDCPRCTREEAAAC